MDVGVVEVLALALAAGLVVIAAVAGLILALALLAFLLSVDKTTVI